MALSVTISGVAFDATEDFSIRQQGSSVSSTTISVLLANQILPRSLQSCVLYIDGTPVFGGVIKTVGTPTWSTGYESMVFALTVQSWEVALQYRLVTKTWYNATWSTILGDLWTGYIVEENLTLGGISTITTTVKKYSVSGKTIFDVLTDIATQVGAAAFWITPEKTFFFHVATGFVAATVPGLVSGLKQSDDYSDLRTVQAVTGASSSIKGNATNADLVTEVAALSGLSGKIEKTTSDSKIHNPTAAARAQELLEIYDEREKTIDAICHDLGASQLYRSWAIDRADLEIQGAFVVTERTITHFVGSEVQISVKLKSRGYFSRYGYVLKSIEEATDSAASNLSDMASDSRLTPVEKYQLRTTWTATVAEVVSLDHLATTYGQNTEKVSFDTAFRNLANYLSGGDEWSSGYPGWIADDEVGETTEIDADEWAQMWSLYSAAKVTLANACNSAARAFVEESVNSALGGTGYQGLFDDAPGSVYVGDYYYNTTTHKIMVLGSDGWIDDTDSSHFAAAAPDILAFEGAGLGANAQAISFVQSIVGKNAFFDALKARTIEVTGTIHATDGEFAGKLVSAQGNFGTLSTGDGIAGQTWATGTAYSTIQAWFASTLTVGVKYNVVGRYGTPSPVNAGVTAWALLYVIRDTATSTTVAYSKDGATATLTIASSTTALVNEFVISSLSTGTVTSADIVPDSTKTRYLGSSGSKFAGVWLPLTARTNTYFGSSYMSNSYPTRGGIYEYGESTSGRYMLFTNGICIQFGTVSLTTSSSAVWNGFFIADGSFSFPFTFSELIEVIPGVVSGGSLGAIGVSGESVSSASIKLGTSNASSTYTVGWMAIGRWW